MVKREGATPDTNIGITSDLKLSGGPVHLVQLHATWLKSKPRTQFQPARSQSLPVFGPEPPSPAAYCLGSGIYSKGRQSVFITKKQIKEPESRNIPRTVFSGR